MTSFPEHRAQSGVLMDRLVGLAGTPDDCATIETDLIVVAQVAATRIPAADSASVTGRGRDGYETVAASSDLAVVADKAQYGDDAGPCLQALTTGRPVATPLISATTAWPGLRETARQVGIRASLSIPLFTGSGRTVASLNLYSRRPGALTALSTAICEAYDPQTAHGWDHDGLDDGEREMTAGVIGALALRAMIQQAIRLLAADAPADPGSAYPRLRTRAAETGASLTDAAAQVIEEHQDR
ncbi:transcriptional regulator [Actinoplanes cyaneus]|uniref:Transcriptional regulator n=1 Tax=Actinoplanes cyaneus TaxID=52696 RepID=A0A919IQT8_9ACTN|nr:GAF and ANTAR domain-containing protein [Actinoplanes cyaneus]MCW2140729.1 GAF domain-containing protein [Actinoplanes cyaneus]GID70074.1 transcriptional regulator [Actinoplanes cyaneus]